MNFKRLLPLVLACTPPLTYASDPGFTYLFDGQSLTGWEAARSQTTNDWGAFSVNESEKAIHAYAEQDEGSEQVTDCLVFNKKYSHYILKLEYKWLDKRFAPRETWDRDAGLLFHVHGDLKKVWPRSIEMQIGETPGPADRAKRYHSGDLFVLGPGLYTHTPREDKWYSADSPVIQGKHVRTSLGIEKPKGQWNEIEIHVNGAEKATFILNGEVVLETFNFVNESESGSTTPISEGHIGLQAEWAEILYRNIRIKEISAGFGREPLHAHVLNYEQAARDAARHDLVIAFGDAGPTPSSPPFQAPSE